MKGPSCVTGNTFQLLWVEEKGITAYKGVPHIVEKENTVVLCRIIHRNQNGTWLVRRKRNCRLFYCHVYPHIMSPGGQNYGTMFLGMASCITFRMYAVFNINLKFLTVIS